MSFPIFFGTNTVTPTAKSGQRIDVHRRSSEQIPKEPQELPTAQLLDISGPMHYDLSISSEESKTGLGEIKKQSASSGRGFFAGVVVCWSNG